MEAKPVSIIGPDNYNGTREKMIVDAEMIAAQTHARMYYMNIPDVDVQLVVEKTSGPCNEEKRKQLKFILAQNRYANRICDRFGRGCENGTRQNLIICSDCHLTFWCSKKCQALALEEHQQQRCNKECLDAGPLQIAFMQI